MKPNFIKIIPNNVSSFFVRKDEKPFFYGNLLYHTEIEIMTVIEGTGTRFIGDNIEEFEPGEVILLGSNIPHMWHSDPQYFENNPNIASKSIVIQFRDDFLGKHFFEIPEMQQIKLFLDKTSRGLKIQGETRDIVRDLMFKIAATQSSYHMLIDLLNMLNILSNAYPDDLIPLTSKGFINDYTDADAFRINEIYNYALKNYAEEIELKEIASIANMNPSAFCRYFKTKTRNTFTQFLSEIRIGKACKFIIEDRLTISQICYKTGFQNISNFNRQFKKIMNQTPIEYKNKYLSSK